MLKRSFFVPAGVAETFIGGDLGSKHFFVGPQAKLKPMAEAVIGSPIAAINAHAVKTSFFIGLPRKAR
jgi:hypothetical protein